MAFAGRSEFESRSKRPKVHLTGGEGIGWALDQELETTRRVLRFVKWGGWVASDVIHTVHWPVLRQVPRQLLIGKRVVSHLSHDPIAAVAQPGFQEVLRLVSLWVVRSHRAKRQLEAWGVRAQVIPYVLDVTTFHPLPKDSGRVRRLAEQWAIPSDAYLIGSFQRDTEGRDLLSPKLVKGPDLFAEIVADVRCRYPNVHVILAGPRRHWLRQRLSDLGVPFTFVGKVVEDDDIRINNLTFDQVNCLYNLVDLYLVSSRLEGGPQAVIEAAAVRCAILSSDVGHAREILHEACVYSDAYEAARCIDEAIQGRGAPQAVEHNYQSVQESRPEALEPRWRELYDRLYSIPPISRRDIIGTQHTIQLAWNWISERLPALEVITRTLSGNRNADWGANPAQRSARR
jgi:glycosyltransferase involved in cell wall biosynthesis